MQLTYKFTAFIQNGLIDVLPVHHLENTLSENNDIFVEFLKMILELSGSRQTYRYWMHENGWMT